MSRPLQPDLNYLNLIIVLTLTLNLNLFWSGSVMSEFIKGKLKANLLPDSNIKEYTLVDSGQITNI